MLRRALIAALAAALPVAAAAQQTQSAQEFLKSIYEPYQKEGFKGQPYDEAKRFFVPDLAQAIDKDMQTAKQKNEVPQLDGDPFIDAQDWQITGLAYASSMDKERTKAAGAVAFINAGEPQSIALALVNTPDGWRIHDIVSRNGSLRALYKLK